MDAINLLKADHRTVEALFKQFEKLQKSDGPAAKKKQVVSKIIKELAVHAAIEEEVFYPGVRAADQDLGDTVLEGLEEHHLVKITLSELETLAPSDERYDAKVTVLMESVRHHVKEEETELFPEVRKAVGRKGLADMGAELAKAKKTAPRKPNPSAPDTPPANLVANRSRGTAKSSARTTTAPRSTGTRTTATRTRVATKARTAPAQRRRRSA